MKIRIVNPGKKGSTMARNKKGQFTKGSRRRRRRRRRSNPEYTSNPSAPRRRRRRSSAPRRRRRRNSSGGGGGGGGFQPFKSYDMKDLLPYGLSQLAQAFAVRRWGDAWGGSMLSGATLATSGYRGQAWTLKNYLICTAVGWVGAKVIAKTGALGGASAARIWWRSAIEQMATRLIWTELFARWSWGQQNFGQLPAGCTPGQVYDDGQGNRWLCSANGQWVSMQGLGGYGELVQAGPLGFGELVQAGPLGDAGGYMPLGHLLDPSTSYSRNEQAQQLGLGSRDPYAAQMAA